MNENYMGPAQAMEGQLQGIVRDATASAADQRAARSHKAQDLQDMAKLIDWHLSTAKDLYATDKLASYDMWQGGMRLMNREGTSFEQYDSAKALTDGAAEDFKNGDLSAMKFKLSQGDKLGYFRNTADIARASELHSQLRQREAEQQAKAIADAQPQDPQMKRARELVSMAQMGGGLGNLDPDERVRLTGKMDPTEQEHQLRLDQQMVEGRDAKQKVMQRMFQLDPAAYGKASDITMTAMVDPNEIAKAKVSDYIALGDARTPEQTAEMIGIAQTRFPHLADAMGFKSAQLERDRNQALLEDTRSNMAELDEHLAVDGKAAASVTSLGAAVKGLRPDPFDTSISASFDTVLTPEEETQFKAWKQKYAPRDSGVDYDLRGAFKAGVTPAGPEAGKDEGHFPDTYKKPNHPTFSDQSKYAAYGKPGHWDGDTFVPGTKQGDGIALQPVDDQTGKQLLLAEGTRVLQGETYKIETAPRIKALEGKIQAAEQQRQQMATMSMTAFPGQREMMVRKQKELESEVTAKRAMVRLLRDESEYAIADRKSALLMDYTPQGRMDLEKLEKQREADLKIVEDEQARLRRRETMLHGKQTEADRKAEQEQNLIAAHKAVDAISPVGKPGLTQAIREAAERYGVAPNDLGKRVQEARSTGGLWEAQNTFATLPPAMQTVQQAGRIAKQYGVSSKDVLQATALPNKPGVEVNLNTGGERTAIAEERSELDMLGRINELYDPGFVGPVDSRMGYLKSATGLIKDQEAKFRASVGLMRTQLRKLYFGTAQSRVELQGALDAIPDINMSDAQFQASLEVSRQKVLSILKNRGEVMEQSGVRAPKGKSMNERYEELRKSGKGKTDIFQQLQREGF